MNSAIYFLRRQIFYLSLHTNIKPKNMNSIHDIADYIILRVKSEDKNASLINLKLQKLLYSRSRKPGNIYSFQSDKVPLF